MKRFTAIGLVVFACAACGGPTTHIYTKAATSACLKKAGIPVGPAPASDFVANSATGGALSAKPKGNRVTVSFGETVDDANNIDDAYRRFRAKNVGIDDVLRTQQNAVMLWHVHPTDENIAVITGCLKS